MKNIYYFRYINELGGIETFFYELAKKYKDYDLTIYYNAGDYKQIKRLRKYVRVKKYRGEKIICDKAFFNFNTDIIDNVEAKEYVLVIHGNYHMVDIGKIPNHPKINTYYAVSKDSAKAFTELTGKSCGVIYNPLTIEEEKKVVKLVAASRLVDKVKGATRLVELINKIEEYANKNDREYLFLVFSDEDIACSERVIFRKPTLNIRAYLKDADYVVQLSDNFEGYNYTVNEALSLNTPVVITPCNVYEELGINKDMAIYLDFDLKNIDEVVKEIFEGKEKSFKYSPPKDSWDKVLVKGKSTYNKNEEKIKVMVIRSYFDTELEREVKEGEVIEVAEERAEYLNGNNKNNLQVATII